MRRNLLAAALMLVLGALAQEPGAESRRTGSISGTVRDAYTGQPLEAVTVDVTINGKDIASVTDAQGRYNSTVCRRAGIA
jgi:hypothetical protein